MTTRLYTKDYHLNEAGRELSRKTSEAIAALFMEYVEKGYSVIDISHVLHDVIKRAEHITIAGAQHPEE